MVLTSSRAGNLYLKPIFLGRGGRVLFYTLRLSDFYGSYGETTARKDPEEKLLACRYGALRLGYLVKGPEVVDWLEVVDWVLVVLHRSILFYTFHCSASKPC